MPDNGGLMQIDQNNVVGKARTLACQYDPVLDINGTICQSNVSTYVSHDDVVFDPTYLSVVSNATLPSTETYLAALMHVSLRAPAV